MSEIRVNAINEQAADAGVTIEGVLFRDGAARLGHGYDVRSFGAVGGATNDTVAFEAACAAAAAAGVNRVVIPFDTFTVTGPADAQGCAVIGAGNTVVTGWFENAPYVEGVSIAGVFQGYAAQHPTIPFDAVPKCIQYVDANTYYAFVENATRGYALLIFKNNVTTVADSIASTSSDTTQYRLTGFLHCVEVFTGYLTPSAENGTWGTTAIVGGVPAYNAGVLYNYRQSTTIGAWAEFAITVPADGFFSVTFVRGASASDDVDVAVDGVAIDTNIDTTAASADLYTKTYRTTPGAHTIRITNQTAGSTGLNIAGINFATLREQRPDVTLDTLGYFRHTTNYISPIDQNSANDYAIREATSGVYGGSYHGGEGTFALSILVDGAPTTVSSGFRVCRSLELIQTSVITWPSSGPTVDVLTRHVLHKGGYSLALTLTGTVTVSEVFTTLLGFNENFTHLAFPRETAFSTLANNERYSIGQTGAAEYRHSTTGQRVRVTHSTYTQPESRYGGTYIWKVNGFYLKYYNPWIHTGRRTLGSIASVVTVQAS